MSQQARETRTSTLPSQQSSGAQPSGSGGVHSQLVQLQGEGLEAQQAVVDPNKQPGVGGPGATSTTDPSQQSGPGASKEATPAADAAAEGAEVKDAPSGAEELSPIREALLKQFQLMEGKGVGDAAFAQICSEGQWKALKAKEQAGRDAIAKWEAGGKVGPKPPAVAVYTTCIDTQRAVAAQAFAAAGVAVKRAEGRNYDMFAFGTLTREEGMKIDAWVEASPGMSMRPRPGDMLMLEKAGGKVDDLGAALAFRSSQFQRKKRNIEKQIAQMKQAIEAGNQVKLATANIPRLEAQLAKAVADMDAASQQLGAKVAAAEAEVAKRVAGGAKLAFSHVGFFKSGTPDVGEDGVATGKERWQTFDGGQSGIAGAVDGQGAKSSNRVYDPATNMVSGEVSQGGAPRWLAGWIDADRMVKQVEEQTPTEG